MLNVKTFSFLEFPSIDVTYISIENLRESIQQLFKENPNQHAELRSRIAHQNM
ncbi:hypothetical protein [Peribacillus saganii]|uniref:hypothetical protein n=1 Tax=Peribacillus saganii TaxID=2303992 RepID=UPI001314BAD3|nr:hypothetical protein [Peribacillus saganii]